MTDWVDTLAKEAESRWIGLKPLFLAQIPPLLRERGIDINEVRAGRSLRLAITMDASNGVRLVQDPDRPLDWAVIPSSTPKDVDLKALFSKLSPTRTDPEGASQPPKYVGWFWAAFVKSLAPGMRRWVSSDRFIDRPESDGVLPQAAEVTVDDIVHHEAGAPTANAAVSESIRAWAARTGVRVADFEAQLTTQPAQKVVHHKPSLAFESLDQDDLKRIVVPLDIVMKLLRR